MRKLGIVLQRVRDRFLPQEWPALRWLLGLHILLQLTGIFWDLPASFEWENDGVAPRDFFAGIALNLPPGPGHTYPLLHNLLLGLLNLPTLLISLLTAPSWQPDALVKHILDYPTMTPVYLLAKLLSVATGTLALAALTRVTARLWTREAGTFAAAWAMTNLTVAYYGRTVNLDGPYLCWMALAADRLLDVLETGNPRDYKIFALLVAASIATKDQAYAAWLLPGLLFLLVFPLFRPLPAGKAHWRRLLVALGVGALGLGLLGGGLLNPPGFLNRLHTLTGPASQNWRSYDSSLAGLQQNLLGTLRTLPDDWWPLPVLLLILPGLALALRLERLPRLLPLLLALSHFLGFTLVVARVGARFTLPTGFWLASYLGVATAFLLEKPRLHLKIPLILLWLLALSHTLTVQVAQWTDARHPLEAWLEQLPPGTQILTLGPVVSQPRWGRSSVAHLQVTRLGPEPTDQRNPLIGVTELQGDWQQILDRQPQVIVVPGPFLSEFSAKTVEKGAIVQEVVVHKQQGMGAQVLAQLAGNRLEGYTVRRLPNQYPQLLGALGLPLPHVHSSVGEEVYVATRLQGKLPELPQSQAIAPL